MASFIIAFLVLLGYSLTRKAWELSDLISLGMMGFFVKMFKIKSMRDATLVNN